VDATLLDNLANSPSAGQRCAVVVVVLPQFRPYFLFYFILKNS